MRILKLTLLLVLFISFSTKGQSFFQSEFEGQGQLFTGEESPFWMHSNTLGRLDEKSHLYGLFRTNYLLEDPSGIQADFGLSLMYKDGYEEGIRLDEAYVSINSSKLEVILGKKHKEVLFKGLSATNENILWSLNSPAIPGIQIFTRKPVFLFAEDHGIGFMAGLEEYLLNDERYIENTRLHHKFGKLVYRSQGDFEISIGGYHFVQWAGISEEFGKLPNSFDDYLRIFFSRPSENDVGDGQEVNALGNQLGSYEIKLSSKIQDIDFTILYNSIFEDGSGMKMGNFPDGRYAIYFEDNRDSFWGVPWLKAFMYEFYYTKNQSRTRQSSEVDGADNYFNNNLYRSGWTYQNQVIGVPFILLNDNRFRIGTNITAVHHLGMSGEIVERYPYRFLLSYRQNLGRKDSFFQEKEEIFSTLLELNLIDSDYQLKAQFGADLNLNENSNFGVGLNFSKTIF
ncbi:capsule assembly Wzi family protein [Gramella sp. GC03-9]|uniref:Capsule assembly Wzi family protein n=1 Tax=Christiangramia oceanisediminis TaxID=2920386 RepID=A0A9X2I2P8_9FLAO|nr:capsule assembly Wzi family protein [Gramella oceanisediminis]MCP9199916.1 capsule assembly Wzi family protein [Gramella oceanisediminis]